MYFPLGHVEPSGKGSTRFIQAQRSFDPFPEGRYPENEMGVFKMSYKVPGTFCPSGSVQEIPAIEVREVPGTLSTTPTDFEHTQMKCTPSRVSDLT